MTRTLYYDDPYLTSFTATIQRIEPASEDAGAANADTAHGETRELVLDATAFYPEGGGQPADIGTIANLPVTHVHKKNGEILHRVATAPGSPPIDELLHAGQELRGEIDWEHRHDYMQQHTGQHVISAAFVHTGAYPTISVHQGEEHTTIEIDAAAPAPKELSAVEDRANEIVTADVAVRDYLVDERNVPALELRRPPKVSGTIRIVEIDGFDRVACGGVHLLRTGEVGWIKLIDTERIRGRVRTVWKIGRRAMADYRLRTRVTAALTDHLSVQVPEIPDRVEKLQERLGEREWELQNMKRRVAALLGDRMAAEAAGTAVTGRLSQEDAELLRDAAEHVAREHGRPVAVVAPQETRLRWCIGLPADGTLNVNKQRDYLLEPISGKGGGKPPYFQGIAEKPEGADLFFQRFRELVEAG